MISSVLSGVPDNKSTLSAYLTIVSYYLALIKKIRYCTNNACYNFEVSKYYEIIMGKNKKKSVYYERF